MVAFVGKVGVDSQLVEFYQKRAKGFLEFYGLVDERSLCRFFGISRKTYPRFIANIKRGNNGRGKARQR